jgi:hypothetical protein
LDLIKTLAGFKGSDSESLSDWFSFLEFSGSSSSVSCTYSELLKLVDGGAELVAFFDAADGFFLWASRPRGFRVGIVV